MIDVILGWVELQIAAFVGCQRRIRAIYGDRHDRYGSPEYPWDVDVFGAGAEMATAKALDRYWSDTPDPDVDGDVGVYFVRSTTHWNGHLLLYEGDPDESRFVLVIARPPLFRLVGWMRAVDGKINEFWNNEMRTPCFKVPQNVLRSMEEWAA